jgi:isopropylmalate/homocitrate/citramalate synthase
MFSSLAPTSDIWRAAVGSDLSNRFDQEADANMTSSGSVFSGPGFNSGKWLVNGLYWEDEALSARPHGSDAIRFIDCTLTEGDDCVGHQLNFNTRLELMRRLDAIGVGEITLPSHTKFAEQVDLANAYRRLNVSSGLNFKGPGVSLPLEGKWQEAIRRAVDNIGPDTLSMAIKYPKKDSFSDFSGGLSKDDVADGIRECVAFAKSLGQRVVPWFLEMRLPVSTVAGFAAAAVEAGADGVYMVDSRGNCSPLTSRLFIQRVREAVGDEADIYVQHHNDIGLATASALASVEGGATWVDAAVLGISERGGCVALEEAAVALEMYGVSTGIDLTGLYELGKFVQQAFGVPLAPWKPIVGETWCMEEGWGHLSQQGAVILADADVDEVTTAAVGVAPAVVGRSLENVIGGKILFGSERSSASSDVPVFVYQLAEELGFTPSPDELATILLRCQAAVATSYARRYITFAEFEGICRGVVCNGDGDRQGSAGLAQETAS